MVFAEELVEILEADGHRHLVGPRRDEGGLEAEELADVLAPLPGRDQLGDVGERVAPIEQVADQAQAGQVGVGVEPDPARAPRGRQETAVLVRPHVAHGRPRLTGQLVDPVLSGHVDIDHCNGRRCLDPLLLTYVCSAHTSQQ